MKTTKFTIVIALLIGLGSQTLAQKKILDAYIEETFMKISAAPESVSSITFSMVPTVDIKEEETDFEFPITFKIAPFTEYTFRDNLKTKIFELFEYQNLTEEVTAAMKRWDNPEKNDRKNIAKFIKSTFSKSELNSYFNQEDLNGNITEEEVLSGITSNKVKDLAKLKEEITKVKLKRRYKVFEKEFFEHLKTIRWYENENENDALAKKYLEARDVMEERFRSLFNYFNSQQILLYRYDREPDAGELLYNTIVNNVQYYEDTRSERHFNRRVENYKKLIDDLRQINAGMESTIKKYDYPSKEAESEFKKALALQYPLPEKTSDSKEKEERRKKIHKEYKRLTQAKKVAENDNAKLVKEITEKRLEESKLEFAENGLNQAAFNAIVYHFSLHGREFKDKYVTNPYKFWANFKQVIEKFRSYPPIERERIIANKIRSLKNQEVYDSLSHYMGSLKTIRVKIKIAENAIEIGKKVKLLKEQKDIYKKELEKIGKVQSQKIAINRAISGFKKQEGLIDKKIASQFTLSKTIKPYTEKKIGVLINLLNTIVRFNAFDAELIEMIDTLDSEDTISEQNSLAGRLTFLSNSDASEFENLKDSMTVLDKLVEENFSSLGIQNNDGKALLQLTKIYTSSGDELSEDIIFFKDFKKELVNLEKQRKIFINLSEQHTKLVDNKGKICNSINELITEIIELLNTHEVLSGMEQTLKQLLQNSDGTNVECDKLDIDELNLFIKSYSDVKLLLGYKKNRNILEKRIHRQLKKAPLVQFEAEKIQLDINDGFIEHIVVFGKIKRLSPLEGDVKYDGLNKDLQEILKQNPTWNTVIDQQVKFTNIYPYGFSSIKDFEQFKKLKVYSYNGDHKEFEFELNNMFPEYIQTLQNDRLDFSPKDQVVKLPVEKEKQGKIILKKDKSSELFHIAVYSDFNGLKATDPNGVIQFELNKRIPLYTKKTLPFRYLRTYWGFANFVELNFRWSRLDAADDENNLTLSYIPNIIGIEDESISYVTQLNLLRYENIGVGGTFGIFSWDLPLAKIRFEANIGGRYGRVRVLDTKGKKVFDDDGKSNIDKPFEINTWRYYPEFKAHLRPEERYGADVGFRTIRFNTVTTEFSNISSEDVFTRTLTDNPQWLHQIEINAHFSPSATKDDLFFFRYRYTNNSSWEYNGFSEIQVGYSMQLKI